MRTTIVMAAAFAAACGGADTSGTKRPHNMNPSLPGEHVKMKCQIRAK